MKRELTYRVIKELNHLYTEGTIKAKPYLVNHVYIKHLKSFHRVHIDHKKISSLNDYNSVYMEEIYELYERCRLFLESNNLVEPYWDFKEDDILTLMIIKDNKEEIVTNEMTQNQISSFYFRNEDAKYLRKSLSLSKAILRLLAINEFPGDSRDQQYLICIQTKTPKAILLCENIDKLRWPDKYRLADIELWYAGGKNIEKLGHIRESEKLPIYYVCDWDYDGLLIFQAIKRDYIPGLKLVVPDDWKNVKRPLSNHKSIWQGEDFPGTYVSEAQAAIISQLIQTNSWIEEESFTFDLHSLN